MLRRLRRLVILGASGVMGVAPSTAVGQAAGPAAPASDGTWTTAPFVGVARHSPVGSKWGTVPDRDHLFIGLHVATGVVRAGIVRLAYAPNLVPLAVVRNNSRSGAGGEVSSDTDRKSVVGFGVAPVGLQASVPLSGRVELYGNGAAGVIWFTDAIPVREARRFNGTLEWGGGLTIHVRPRRSVQVGYKFHHISNLYTARANPGVDANVFYVSLRYARGKRAPS